MDPHSISFGSFTANRLFKRKALVTERVKPAGVKNNIRNTGAQYQQLLHGLPAAIYTCDVKGRIMLYNRAAANLWGREPEIGKDLWCGSWKVYNKDGTPLPPDKYPMAMAIAQGRAENGEEIIIERPDGRCYHVQPHPQLIFDASGKIVGAVNMLIDITKSKRAETALRESEERFRKIADTAPAMIWMCDVNKSFTFLNKGWLSFTGRSLEKELGNGWTAGIHKDDLERCLSNFVAAFDACRDFYLEYRLKKHTGEYRWVSNHGVPRYGPDGIFEGYTGSCWDIHNNITASEELEKKVEKRTEELKLANEELEQFAFMSSLDLQEPLQKIEAFSAILEKSIESSDPEIKKYFERIKASARHMNILLKDLLSFSQLVKTDEKFVFIDLGKLLEEVKKDFEILIEQKKAIICSSRLPVIRAIPLQMKQLFYNLLSNSLKFSEENPVINISAKEILPDKMPAYLQLAPGTKYVQLIFKDNGIGFEKQYDKKIFTIFHRLNDQKKYSGSGIGLAICKKIAENHYGTITAAGSPGRGATFNVYLPFDLL